MTQTDYEKEGLTLLRKFERESGFSELPLDVVQHPAGPRLVIRLVAPQEQHFHVANSIADALPEDHPFYQRISLTSRPLKELDLASPEVRLLVRILSGTLTADRHVDPATFRSKYVSSQSGAEEQVVSTSNHIVFGRRGAGKSTLLLYAMDRFRDEGLACVWIDMQTYDQRDDLRVHCDLLLELGAELNQLVPDVATEFISELKELRQAGSLSLPKVRSALPALKLAVKEVVRVHSGLCIFLDDLHVMPRERQPELLSVLYACARGNRVWLKASALEHFTNHWDPNRRLGLEEPGDTQYVHLDYNLTNPERALEHITEIMDALARQCALPDVGAILNKDVLSRLVWVAAGVPRDALNILQQSIARAAQQAGTRKARSTVARTQGRKRVAVEDVNVAASRCLEDKMRFLSLDTSGEPGVVNELLDEVRDFCVKQQKKNAFLLAIQHDAPRYQAFLKLIDLRFLHVLNQGITRNRTGEKYHALLLDYGFYTGARKAKTVDVLQKKPERLKYEELRKLPVFPL